MKMFLSRLHRTLYINNRTVLKSLLVENETHNMLISEKCYSTLDTSPEYSQRRNVDKLYLKNLSNFRRMRNVLVMTRNYDNTTTTKSNFYEVLEPEIIRSIKCIDWSHLKSLEILMNFKLLSVNALRKNEEITGEDYREIVSVLTEKCWKLNDNELHTLLKCLEMWPSIQKIRHPSNPVRKLLEQIDKELDKRSGNWALDKTLLYCDTICRIFSFHSSFVSNSLNRLTVNPSVLSYKNIVQIMYYLFIYVIQKSRVRHLEPYIEDYFDKFTIEELGIICLGYFRAQVHITSDTLLCKLMQKVIDNVGSINNNEMGSFFKIIRYSFMSKPQCVQKCEELFKTIVPRVPDMADPVVTHLSHLVADSQIYNSSLMPALLERFTKDLQQMRLKDIERMVFLITTFNIPQSEPLYDLIIEELGSSRRESEIRNFPREYGFTLRHLALANIYPLHLISTVMSRKHMNLAYGPNLHDLGVEYIILDQSIEIEVPQYRGPRIDNAICNVLAKKYNVTPTHSFGSQAKERIIQILNNIFDSKNASCLQRILPHFTQTDIILCLDENNNAIPPEPILDKINTHIKRVPEEFKNKKWIAIILATETLLIRGTNEFTGNLSAKIRHLEKVGYVPIVVPHVEWKILYSDSMKNEYIRKKIFKSTHSREKKEFVLKAL